MVQTEAWVALIHRILVRVQVSEPSFENHGPLAQSGGRARLSAERSWVRIPYGPPSLGDRGVKGAPRKHRLPVAQLSSSVLGVNGQHVWLPTKGCGFDSRRTLQQGVAQSGQSPRFGSGLFVGSNPTALTTSMWVRSSTAEQVIFNHQDEGANPSEPTTGL